MAMRSDDGVFIAYLHRRAQLVDIVDDEWAQDVLGQDDFDLPASELDSDNDEVRSVPQVTAASKILSRV